jgi:bacteriocin biosynthesis cyclodehydratase domain-containing protein
MPSNSDLPTFPVLVGFYDVVRLGDGRVQVRSGASGVTVTTDGRDAELVELLHALDGKSSRSALERRYPLLTGPILDALAQRGMLSEAEESDEQSGAGMSGAAWALGRAPADVQRRLRDATVVMVGLGPVAVTTALLLAKAGVSRFLLEDRDDFTAAEVALCPALPMDAVRRPRVDVVGELCRGLSAAAGLAPARVLVGPIAENYLALIEERYDELGMRAAEECLETSRPYILYGQDGLTARIGPLIGQGGQPCHRCLEIRRRSHRRAPEEDDAYRQQRAKRNPSSDCLLAAHTSALAGILGTEALRTLGGVQPTIANTVLSVDLRDFSVEREHLLAVPTCPQCGSVKAQSTAETLT